MADLATRMQNALDASVELWAARGFVLVTNAVKENLSGGVLKVRTGRLRDSIGLVSRIKSDGFVVGTNVVYGIAWEKGFTRPKRPLTIRPRKKKALRWFKGGNPVFAKKVVQLPKKYKARPFLEPAISKSETRLVRILGETILEKFGDIPDISIDVRIL